MRKELFNDNWNFKKESINKKKETDWKPVDLPHDWLIYNSKDLYEDSIGYYRKSFEIDNIEKKYYKLYFEGVYMNSSIYVNDSFVGEWKYGYSSFEFDITKFLKLGKNVVDIKIIHQSPNSRWYSGAGIYRNVWLIKTEHNYLSTDGIYITTKNNSNGWSVNVETEINCIDDVVLKQTIIDNKDEKEVVNLSTKILKKLDKSTINENQTMYVESPVLWDIENPYLYRLKTELLKGNKIVDEIVQNFGFRTIRFDSNDGFFLNEKHIKLHGVCEHHDLGALGSAVNKVAIKRRFNILKEMGVNSIRTAHNMPAVEFMDLADEMGFLIISEGFDMWELSKTEYDYGKYFKEWHEKDTKSWIKRDRNHPSIIMWSIGNEIYDTHTSTRGIEITKVLTKIVRLYDSKENALITIGSNYMAWENAQKCANEIQVVGYNYAESLYDEHHKKYPHWVIYGSETASTVQSRGVYHFPASVPTLTHDDEQCSSLGNCTTGWGAKSTQRNIIDDRDTKYCLGQFIWTGFDYIGEPTPYFTKNSYFGQLDTAGFKKDSFYIYQAEWTSYKVNPMVHILPYWDFNENQLIDIRIYSNAPKTELFFNDKSCGVFEIDHNRGQQLSGIWQIPYKKGTIKALAYDENNKIIARDEQSSFKDAKKIVMKADKLELLADGNDLIFIEINTLDEDNNLVANANNRIFIDIIGEGRLLGLDNGDSTDYDQYKGNNRKLFNGRLLTIVGSKLNEGNIKLKAYSKGLESCEIEIISKSCNKIKGVSGNSYIECNYNEYINDKIPVRKIELTNHGVNLLNKDNISTTVSAKIYPKEASYKDLNWIVTTLGGFETNIARVEVEGDIAVVKALGDGEFKLRCSCNNDSSNPVVLSELEFKVDEIGSAVYNPYKFIPAITYSLCNLELRNGNLGGVVTKIDDMNYITYENVDFGNFGSNKITIPVFYWGDNKIPIEFWNGIPGKKDAKLIQTLYYQGEKRWNTYVPNTIELDERIKGLKTITFGINEKLHFKGFEFEYIEKAFSKLMGVDNDKVYGDSFEVVENSIKNIGNNVVMEFNDMNFDDNGFDKLIICGKSHIPVNTIHIRFSSEDGDINQIVEFEYTDNNIEKEFLLKSIKGHQKVSLVFLPGSKFDLNWMQFVKK